MVWQWSWHFKGWEGRAPDLETGRDPRIQLHNVSRDPGARGLPATRAQRPFVDRCSTRPIPKLHPAFCARHACARSPIREPTVPGLEQPCSRCARALLRPPRFLPPGRSRPRALAAASSAWPPGRTRRASRPRAARPPSSARVRSGLCAWCSKACMHVFDDGVWSGVAGGMLFNARLAWSLCNNTSSLITQPPR